MSTAEHPTPMTLRGVIVASLLCLCVAVICSTIPVHAQDNVIYGSSTGLPPEATIKEITFARSGENLVTTFQVSGQMSGSYAYYVGIAPSSIYGTPYEYEIATSGNVGVQSNVITHSSNSLTNIQGTMNGDTWTAYTPLSLIGYSTHLWVFAGTTTVASSHSGCQSNCNSEWLDFYPVISSPTFFEVSLPTQVHFTLEPSLISNNVTLSLGGEQYHFDSSGQLEATVEGGVSNSISITPAVQPVAGVRYTEVTWSDTGYTGSSRSLELDQDSSITISYKTQFLLTASSDYANVTGGGWYDETSTATISVTRKTVPYNGFLGALNLEREFNGWSGDVSSGSTPDSFIMDSPKTVTANWSTAYSVQFFLFLGLAIGLPIVGTLLLYQRRIATKPEGITQPVEIDKPVKLESNEPETQKHAGSKKSTMFCLKCGAKIPRESVFCRECGTTV